MFELSDDHRAVRDMARDFARNEVPGSYRATKAQALASWESAYVADLIHRFEGNLSRAARAVKMDRNHLRALLHRYGINYSSRASS